MSNIEAMVESSIREAEDLMLPVKTFADLSKVLEVGYHSVIFGKTRSGKTVLLQNLDVDHVLHGYKVIHRDDGGLEFLKVADKVDITVWKPKDCKFECNAVYIENYDWKNPSKLVKDLLKTSDPYNVVLFDVYCNDKSLYAMFWSDFLNAFITHLMKLHVSKKEHLVLSIDELNDILTSKQHEITKAHASLKAMIDFNLRKLRKHRVKLIATAHRPNQLTRDIRAQFDYIFVKRSYGYDMYDLLNRELVDIDAKTFWGILKKIKTLPVNQALVFDYDGKFDLMEVPKLKDKIPYFEVEGEIKAETEESPTFMARRFGRSFTFCLKSLLETGGFKFRDLEQEMKEYYDMYYSRETFRRDLEIFLRDPITRNNLKEIVEILNLKLEKRVKRKLGV